MLKICQEMEQPYLQMSNHLFDLYFPYQLNHTTYWTSYRFECASIAWNTSQRFISIDNVVPCSKVEFFLANSPKWIVDSKDLSMHMHWPCTSSSSLYYVVSIILSPTKIHAVRNGDILWSALYQNSTKCKFLATVHANYMKHEWLFFATKQSEGVQSLPCSKYSFLKCGPCRPNVSCLWADNPQRYPISLHRPSSSSNKS